MSTALRPAVFDPFLGGARAVLGAISGQTVADAWDEPSVLEEQRVSGLAGHLARGGVWAVADYLEAGNPSPPVDFESAGEYFAAFASTAGPDEHRAIRDRGAAVGGMGRKLLVSTLESRIRLLEERLADLRGDHLVSVIGQKVMHLEDYLATRIVEQGVHLDDLARSVGHAPWPLPEAHRAIVVEVGVEVARRRSGTEALIRALYRSGFADSAFPVL